MATELMTGKFALEMSQRQHAKAKLPLGNRCRQVSEIKMDNPLNSHRIHCGKHERVTGRKKGVIVKLSIQHVLARFHCHTAHVFCVPLCRLPAAERSVCSGRWLKVAKEQFSPFPMTSMAYRLQLFLISKTSAFSQLIMERKPSEETVASTVRARINHVAQETVLRIFPL